MGTSKNAPRNSGEMPLLRLCQSSRMLPALFAPCGVAENVLGAAGL
jgi:hypothetical protein